MNVRVTPRRAVVSTFDELVRRPLRDGRNALCWPRALPGDFDEVARLLAPREGVAVVEPDALAALRLSPAGRTAADCMLADLRALDELGRAPELNCIASYARDERGLPIATDVMSFHADRSPIELDTWMCTYAGRSSEGLDNDCARRLVDDPAIRAALLQLHGGADDDAFAAFLRDGSFDLHYAADDGAQPFSFGTGNLWKIATLWPGCPVPPCLHRAPQPGDADAPRLLLLC